MKQNRKSWHGSGMGSARRRGFTLLEVLVAMSILIVIALMMSTLFGQSRTTYERGTRKTELAMEGRSALNLMTREIAQAVADGMLDDGDMSEGTEISFYTFGREIQSNRLVRFVRYKSNGSLLQRAEEEFDEDDDYPPSPSGGDYHDLLTDLASAVVFTPGPSDGSYGSPLTSLPEWVDIRIELRKASEFSAARVWSFGPDKNNDDGEGDDVSSGV